MKQETKPRKICYIVDLERFNLELFRITNEMAKEKLKNTSMASQYIQFCCGKRSIDTNENNKNY